MSRLKKLPRRGTWEVALFAAYDPNTLKTGSHSMLVIVETSTGALRRKLLVRTGADLGAELIAATAAVASVPAGRPKTVVCAPALVPVLGEAIEELGARLRTAEEQPSASAAFSASLAKIPLAPAAFGVPDPEDWRPVLLRLAEEVPPGDRYDQLWFELEGAGILPGTIGFFSNPIEDAPGVVIVSNSGVTKALSSPKPLPPALPEGQSLTMVRLVPEEQASVRQVEWSWAHKLTVQGMVPQFIHASGDTKGLWGETSALYRTATSAVLEVWRRHGASLSLHATETVLPTLSGPLTVRTTTSDHRAAALLLEDPSLPFDLYPFPPRLIFPVTREEAPRVTRLVERWTSVDFSLQGERLVLTVGYADDSSRILGILPAKELDLPLRTGEISLEIALQDGDLSEEPTAFRVPLSPFKTMDWYHGAWHINSLYEGSFDSWPDAIGVLWDFGSLEDIWDGQTKQAEEALKTLVAVWNAVVSADVLGDSAPLEVLERTSTGQGLSPERITRLIQRKREYFAEDTRIVRLK
ncbi:MAG: hypothetical protein JXX28_14045 [Deltaproteobacteria bacterium]|nr:hypothetical protein [Deltaproteobacteria bacterium]